jgi:hypothetical protein
MWNWIILVVLAVAIWQWKIRERLVDGGGTERVCPAGSVEQPNRGGECKKIKDPSTPLCATGTFTPPFYCKTGETDAGRPTCPAGKELALAANGNLVCGVLETVEPISAPAGTRNKTCPEGYERPPFGDPASYKCRKTAVADPICPAGSTFIEGDETRGCAITGTTEVISDSECPAGMRFDEQTNMCSKLEWADPIAAASTAGEREAAVDVMPALAEPAPRTYSSEFERTLDLYRSNLSQYKVSGNVSFKTASDNAKIWLDQYIASIQSSVDADGKELRDFVKGYEESDQDMLELKSQMADIRSKGPRLQSIYETEHESQKEEPVDYSPYYTKGAVLAGVAVMGIVAAAF